MRAEKTGFQMAPTPACGKAHLWGSQMDVRSGSKKAAHWGNSWALTGVSWMARQMDFPLGDSWARSEALK